MKKSILVLALLLAAAATSRAQFSASLTFAAPMGDYGNKDVARSGYGAGFGMGVGLEYTFATRSFVKPVVGCDMMGNITRKSVKDEMVETMLLNSVRGGGYNSIGLNAGVKLIYELEGVGTYVYLDARARYGYNHPGSWKYEYKTGGSQTTEFRGYLRPGYMLGVGFGFRDATICLSYINGGSIPFVTKDGSDDGDRYVPMNIALTITYTL